MCEISRFKIFDLFNVYNVDIPFDEETKILIGENGSGKTTILGIIYYTLKTQFDKLLDYDFKKIDVYFKSGKEISINKDEIISWRRNRLYSIPSPLIKRLERYFTFDEINSMREICNEKGSLKEFWGIEKLQRYEIPINMIENYFMTLNNSSLNEVEKIIQNEISGEPIYLTTYRRVEKNIIDKKILMEYMKVRPNNTHYDNTLIQFGMKDIEERLNTIKEDIMKAYTEGFTKISAEMLKDMFLPEQKEEIFDIDPTKLKIVVDRMEDYLSEKERETIKHLVDKNPNFKKEEKSGYNNFLNKLVTIYEEHRGKEESINNFRNACNRYLSLTDKKMVYNESSVDVFIKEELYGKPLPSGFECLSSGEKQILSIFAKLYLEEKENFYIFIDEPELSLSIEWQKQLLPDIIKSGKTKFLFAVTHSPFIFDNELDKHAVGLRQYMEVCK